MKKHPLLFNYILFVKTAYIFISIIILSLVVLTGCPLRISAREEAEDIVATVIKYINKGDSENKQKRSVENLNNKKTTKISIYISERAYEDLKKLSVKKRTSMANLVRNFVTKGLNVENHDENEEEFRRMIHDEMTEVIKQEVERLIKLQVKSTKASAITMYTGLQIMSESFADDVSFARVVASASKQAAAYMKQKEKSDDEYMQDTNEILNGMKKVVRAGEE